MRVRALLLAAIAGVVPRVVSAQPAPVIAPFAPTRVAETEAQTPVIGPAVDLTGFAGKPVTRITVLLEGNVWDDVTVPPIDGLKPRDTLTPAAARHVLDALLRTGRFARGSVTVQAEGDGAAVVVRVVPRKLIERLDVDLHLYHPALDKDELLREAGLSEGGEIVGADVGETRQRIERQFALHGYPAARADVRMRDTNDPLRTLVVVDVTPGAPRVIDQRSFYVFGARREQVLPAARSYAVSTGDRADEPALDKADRGLAELLRGKGWYRAEVSHDLAWVGQPPRGGRIVLRVRIDSGPLFVPRFEGNDHYDRDVLVAALALDAETDRSPGHLAEKIRTFYVKRGFYDAEVRAETRGTDGGPLQVLMMRVDERRRVRVVARHYPCLKIEAIKHLSAGGPRSPDQIGTEIDSYLEEELPGADLLVSPNPEGLSATIGSGAGQVATGARPVPIDLSPDDTYVEGTYERAIEHVRGLYRNEGFLHAEVGPAQVVRARCDPRSPAQQCVPMPLPPLPEDICTYDAAGVPLPVQPLDGSFTCRPDAAHGADCAPTMDIVLPVKLGPRTQLWDVAFTGVKSVSEKDVGDAAQLPLGEPASETKIDDARRRIVDWYKELGYYYVDVKYELEPSADNTRALVRFDVTEGEQVFVKSIEVRGLEKTLEGVVRRRIAFTVGQPYRASEVRKTQERVATLGTFSSISVSLADPYVQQAYKTVIVDVVEQTPQYIEPRIGFSTGEGMRGGIEYGHRNLLGSAWGLTVRLQASYLPDFLILDPGVAHNYTTLKLADRIATRDTVTMSWPEMGLGPSVRSQLDGVYVRDLERDFTLFKASILGTLIWRPSREIQISGGPDYEHNDVHLFAGQSIATYLLAHPGSFDLQRLLRVPDGDSNVVAARIVLTWDRRDSAFNAHRGTYVATGIEGVNSYPVQGTTPFTQNAFEGHFLRLTQTVAGYIPINGKLSLAAEVRVGEIVNLRPCAAPFDKSGAAVPAYCTYPDRLFFMGGFDSMRGWLQDTFVPQEYADQIASDPTFTINNVPLRGGNLMINPRLELRYAVHAPFEVAVFSDFGNLWNEPSYIIDHPLTLRSLRADVGAGVRVDTPVGPLVFDYGVNVTRRPYEDFGAFHFAIGLF